jgi:hypothetical protein
MDQGFRFGALLYKGILLAKECTARSLFVNNDARFLALRGGGVANARRWYRYPADKILSNAGWYMPTGSSWDILKYKAIKNVRILGHGVCGPIESGRQDGWTMMLKYEIDGQVSERKEFKPDYGDGDEQNCYCVFYE